MARKRRASRFNVCVKHKLKGKHHKTRVAQRAAFRKAVKACAGKRSHRVHRRRRRR